MTNDLKIGLVMATFNSEKFVEEALQSIANQTVGPFKLYLCDDSSTDATVQLVQIFLKSYSKPFVFLRNEVNRGPGFTLKRLIDEASKECDYVIYHHADDTLPPDYIEGNLPKLNRTIAMLSSPMKYVFDTGKTVGRYSFPVNARGLNKGVSIAMLIHNNYLSTPGSFYNCELLSTDYIDVNSDLYDWGVNLLLQFRGCVVLGKKFVSYRVHSNQVSASTNFERNHVEWFERVLPRILESDDFVRGVSELNRISKLLLFLTFWLLEMERGPCRHTVEVREALRKLSLGQPHRCTRNLSQLGCPRGLFAENSDKGRHNPKNRFQSKVTYFKLQSKAYFLLRLIESLQGFMRLNYQRKKMSGKHKS